MKGVEKIRDGLYVKKSFDGYRIIYPFTNDDGTKNWFNILTGGNYWKLVKLLLIMLLIAGVTWSYMRDTRTCRELLGNAEEWCNNFTTYLEEQQVWANPTLPRYVFPNITNETIFKEVENGEPG